MAERQVKAIGAACSAGAVDPDLIDKNAPLNDKVLLDLARKMGTDYVVVGVSLGLTAKKVEQLEYDYKKAVPINFQILRTWRDKVTSQSGINDMFHELDGVFHDLELEDLCDLVRKEQAKASGTQSAKELLAAEREDDKEKIRVLEKEQEKCKASKEKEIKKLEEKIKTLEENGLTERVRLLEQEKARCKASKEKEIQKLTEKIQALELNVSTAQGARPKDRATTKVSSVPKGQKSESQESTDKSRAAEAELKKAAKRAQGESDEEAKLRKLRVIALVRKYELPHLWSTAADHILEDGTLDLRRIILSAQHVDDLTHLLTTAAARNISKLNLDGCGLGSTKHTEGLFGRATQLTELRLLNNDLHGRPLRALTGQVGAWTKLEILALEYCQLGDDDISSLVASLSSMSSLEGLGLMGNDLTDDSARHVTREVVKLPAFVKLSLCDNWITPRGVEGLRKLAKSAPRVWLYCIDWQRRPGKRDWDDDDLVVTWTRKKKELQATLTLVQGRPLADRGGHWGDDVAWLPRFISFYEYKLKAYRD